MKCPEPNSILSLSDCNCHPLIWQLFNAVRPDGFGCEPSQYPLTMLR